MTDTYLRLRPVILCGGAGSRLWPLSNTKRPKALLAVTSVNTLLQDTFLRFANPQLYLPIIVVCRSDDAALVEEQAKEVGARIRAIICEPYPRGTSTAIALVASLAQYSMRNDTLVFSPADHAIKNEDALHASLQVAGQVLTSESLKNNLAILGASITETNPHLGHFKTSPWIETGAGRVTGFIEKPAPGQAANLVPASPVTQGAGWYWNMGMVIARPLALLAAIEKLQPETLIRLRFHMDYVAAFNDVCPTIDIRPECYVSLPSKDFDRAVLEECRSVIGVPTNCGWSDLGTFASLHANSAHDSDGNALIGDITTRAVTNCYVRTGIPTTLLDVDDLTIVASTQGLLVARNNSGHLGGKLKAEANAARLRTEEKRPWGSYRVLADREGVKLKEITLNPGQKLSYQYHRGRRETWIIIEGFGRVTLDGAVHPCTAGHTFHIAEMMRHRIENLAESEPLRFLEVQTGSRISEEDIVRLADDFGRETSRASTASGDRS